MSDLPSASSVHSAGSLTTLMRAAVPPAGAKALRVGLVHRGKVVDERIVPEREHVTIGPNERATFVVPDVSIPPGFRLFERDGGRYRLQVTSTMSGRIASSAGLVDLAVLRADAPRVVLPGGAGSAYQIRLGDDSRGKITIGDFTILFQFVVPAPPLGKPQLPVNVKSRFGDVDWRTSIIAAFSFLFHFGAVGSIYSDWMDPVVDDEVETAQILESVKQLPAPPPIEHPKNDNAAVSPSASARADAKPAPPSGGRTVTAAPAGGSSGMGNARAHQISGQLAALEMQVLTGLGSTGSATSVVLGPASDLPLSMLDKAAASANGVRMGGIAGLDLGTSSGGPLRPGTITRGPFPGSEAPPMATGAGSAVVVKPPSGTVAVPGPTNTGGNVPNAASVVAGMAAGFRRCYTSSLNHEDPAMRGSVRVTARIGPNGEVLSASASGSGSVSPTLIGCIRNRVASAQFASPEGGGATLVIPVSVIPQ